MEEDDQAREQELENMELKHYDDIEEVYDTEEMLFATGFRLAALLNSETCENHGVKHTSLIFTFYEDVGEEEDGTPIHKEISIMIPEGSPFFQAVVTGNLCRDTVMVLAKLGASELDLG